MKKRDLLKAAVTLPRFPWVVRNDTALAPARSQRPCVRGDTQMLKRPGKPSAAGYNPALTQASAWTCVSESRKQPFTARTETRITGQWLTMPRLSQAQVTTWTAHSSYTTASAAGVANRFTRLRT